MEGLLNIRIFEYGDQNIRINKKEQRKLVSC